MGMIRAILDLMLAILGIAVDTLTSEVVDQGKVGLLLGLVKGRIWVGREFPNILISLWWSRWREFIWFWPG